MRKALITLLVTITLLALPASAKGISGRIESPDGNLYLVKSGRICTGLTKYRGRLYYGHRSKSACYPLGSLAVDCLRIEGGRWYYFGHNGKALNRDTQYFDVRSADSTVRYFFIPGTGKRQRYNTALERYQRKVGNHWEDMGMQCYPQAMMDWQW